MDQSYLSSNYEKICLNSEMIAYIIFWAIIQKHSTCFDIIIEVPITLPQKSALRLIEINGKLDFKSEFQIKEFPMQINNSKFPFEMYLFYGSGGNRIFSGKLSIINRIKSGLLLRN